MVQYEIYSHPIVKYYRASLCSKATFFQIGSIILTIVCPILVAYRSQGFWLKTNFYREQPNVRFRYEFLVVLRSNDPQKYWIWSSYPDLNILVQDRIRIGNIQTRSEDQNRDGKQDVFHLTAQFPIADDEKVHSVQLMLLFDYDLDLYSRFRMIGMASLKYESLLPGAKVQFTGDLRLEQRVPLWYKGIDTRFQLPIFQTSGSEYRTADYDLNKALLQYSHRNVTTVVNQLNTEWLPQTGTVDNFEIDVNLHMREERVEYYSGFWEMIKWGWVQYLSILVVFIFVVSRIRAFVFRNRIVITVPQKKEH